MPFVPVPFSSGQGVLALRRRKMGTGTESMIVLQHGEFSLSTQSQSPFYDSSFLFELLTSRLVVTSGSSRATSDLQ